MLFQEILKPTREIFKLPQRQLWRMLNEVFNRPDMDRIKEVGPDRACAEWLLRCGAHVRWHGANHYLTDYNKLVALTGQPLIAEVMADNAAVMAVGFTHFQGCKGIEKIVFRKCIYLEDSALPHLTHLEDSLKHLEIITCGDITEQGILSLLQLKNLKELVLCDLPEVKDKRQLFEQLTSGLPQCNVHYLDLTKATQE